MMLGRIQVLLVLLVADDLAAICFNPLLLVLLSCVPHEALPLTVPGSYSDGVKLWDFKAKLEKNREERDRFKGGE